MLSAVDCGEETAAGLALLTIIMYHYQYVNSRAAREQPCPIATSGDGLGS
jgi:hypothetical protein